jgi:hypothetical protein
MTNDALIADLKNWSRKARIDPNAFDCPYYHKCNASIGNKLQSGKGCLMSYVGREFGVDSGDGAFRLVVVGIDHGEPSGGNFDESREGLEKWYQKGGCDFNQHYRGVVKTAAAVLGSVGEYGRQMCVTSCQKSRDPASSRCVIDRLAQPNAVKCTPEDQQNRASRVTRPMMENCAYHLIDEIKIFRPGLVVFHGVEARSIIIPKIKERDLHVIPVEGITDAHGPVLYKWPILGAHLLFLYHPTYGWLDAQWDRVVVPALNYLRFRNLIPA